MVMSKIKQFFMNISPLNNRTDMPGILYIIKVFIIFWFVKTGAELIGEGVVIAVCFACGKNPLQGEMFSPNIMMLIMYYGYVILIGIMFLYWKLFQKKTLSELGFTQKVGSYITGVITGTQEWVLDYTILSLDFDKKLICLMRMVKRVQTFEELVVFVSVLNSVRIISANASDDVKQDADEDTQIVVTEYSDLWSGILQ